MFPGLPMSMSPTKYSVLEPQTIALVHSTSGLYLLGEAPAVSKLSSLAEQWRSVEGGIYPDGEI